MTKCKTVHKNEAAFEFLTRTVCHKPNDSSAMMSILLDGAIIAQVIIFYLAKIYQTLFTLEYDK